MDRLNGATACALCHAITAKQLLFLTEEKLHQYFCVKTRATDLVNTPDCTLSSCCDDCLRAAAAGMGGPNAP